MDAYCHYWKWSVLDVLSNTTVNSVENGGSIINNKQAHERMIMEYSVTYEDGFLTREIGSIATKPDVAITELIANGHDAGASEVRIIFPDEKGNLITVEDNGMGLTESQFEKRWLKLRYDRKKHQGAYVEIPEDNNLRKRRLAFGRNGVGRHAGLCFDDTYTVETWRDRECNIYKLELSSGKQPIEVKEHKKEKKSGHGTKIKIVANKNLIPVEELTETISAKFLFNPEFKVYVNGKLITLSEHPGVVKRAEINPVGNIRIKLTLVDSSTASRTAKQHGVAFWLGGRLLGDPSWSINGLQVFDGRRSFAKRYTVIAESEDLFDFIEADWSGFKSDFSALELIADEISDFVKLCYLELSQNEIENAKRQVFDSHKGELRELRRLSRMMRVYK